VNETIEIRHSHWRMASLLFGALSLAMIGGAMGLRFMSGVKPGSFIQFMGYAALIVFGIASAIILRQWIGSSGAVVTLTATGIRDTRVAAEEIPWSAITNLAMWQQGRQKTLVLSVDPKVEEGLTLTRIARWTRGPNKSLGVDGLCVVATGLNVSFDMLAQLIAAHVQRARSEEPAASGDSAP